MALRASKNFARDGPFWFNSPIKLPCIVIRRFIAPIVSGKPSLSFLLMMQVGYFHSSHLHQHVPCDLVILWFHKSYALH